MCAWSDDRQPPEGENRYHFRQKHVDRAFASYYTKSGKELEHDDNFAYVDNLY